MRALARLLLASAVSALALGSLSCASELAYSRASASLEGGDRVGAVLMAAEALSHSAANYRALSLLEAVFPRAVAECRTEAEAALARGDELRWETVVRDWEAIHTMNDAVGALPSLHHQASTQPVVFAIGYDRQLLARAREEAASYRYAEGLRLLASGSRSDARAAYASLKKVQAFHRGYLDSEVLMAKAQELGADRIAVLPFDSRLLDGDSLAFLDILYRGCQSTLLEASISRSFVQVVERSRTEALLAEQLLSSSDLAKARLGAEAARALGANILVFGQLLSLSAERPRLTTRTEYFQVEVDEPIRGALPVEGAAPTQKVEKRGALTIFSKRSSLAATATYRAVDIESSVILDARSIVDTISDTNEWATWTGDRAALPPKYENLVEARDRELLEVEDLMPRLAARMNRTFTDGFFASR
jgi:hypothetical protein